MVLLQLGQETLGCVTLTVVLGLSILLHNRLRHQRNHFPSVRVNDDSAQQLMVVGHLTCLLVDLLQTGLTVNLLRAKVPCAIQRNEVAASKKNELIQSFLPLKLPKDILKHRPEAYWLNVVENRAHLCVARHVLDAIDALQVAICPLALIKSKQ